VHGSGAVADARLSFGSVLVVGMGGAIGMSGASAVAPTLSAPRAGLYTATLGDDGAILDRLAAEVGGLVIAGFGVGHAPESWPPLLAAIAGRVPVVPASRIGRSSSRPGPTPFPARNGSWANAG
jgi:L-asparaginase/Glu-tRNA(Gln) amidotransferase subunit D